MSESSSEVKVTFSVDGLDQTLHVVQCEGTEQVSQLFQFDLVLAAGSDELDFSRIVGRPGLITLTRDSTSRCFSGIVARLQQQQTARNVTLYRAVLVPRVWRLQHRRDCRIFQNLSTREIVARVLGEAKIPAEAFKTRLANNQDTPSWEYCVQYRESDWGFVCRLLEETGFFYFFEHSPGTHLLVMGNSNHFHPAIPGDERVPHHPPSPTLPAGEHISRFFFEEAIRPGRVTLNDWNPLKPGLRLISEVQAARDTDLEIYDYASEHQVPEYGRVLAEVHLQEAQVQRLVGEGDSDCIRFTSGHCFTLAEHNREELNQRYLLTRVQHFCDKHEDLEAGALEGRCRYRNRFECIPQSVPFRPPQRTPKPSARGVQTAVVVGPAGEEIHVDAHGRVKVQFHWDRLGKKDDQSSCWIPVSQLWASKGWGAVWIPRIGDEVVVDFIEGDPDRPIIISRTYHAQNVPPYELPQHKTRSTIKSNSSPGGHGSNEIRFEDKKGAEEIYTHAERDQNEVVEHDLSTRVGNDQSLLVERDRSKEVQGSETNTIVQNRTIDVTRGNQTINIHTGHHSRVVEKGDDSLEIQQGTRTVTVKGDTTLKVTSGRRTVSVAKDYAETVSGNRVTSVSKNYDETVEGSHTENVKESKVVEARTIRLTAEDELVISVGEAQIVITKDGKIQVKGTDMSVEGKDVKTKGQRFSVNTSGPIALKGSQISDN